MHFSFAKYHGLGNDFILIDDRNEGFPAEDAPLIVKLCRRRTGVGADGLILLQDSFKADYTMRIFNSDGKETEMWGNGLRWFMAYLGDLGLSLTKNRILVGGKSYTCAFQGELISVLMGKAEDVSWNIKVPLQGQEVMVHYLNTGVPHVVVFVDDVDQIDVEQVGKEIRWHPIFQPKGVNASFASEMASGGFKMRTYERGVEGETNACGTGAAAVAHAASKMLGKSSPITLWTCLQEKLTMSLSDDGELEMLGGATYVYRGHISQKSKQYITV